jgi:predicted anti-sigma-YlaC factor YlaD
MTFFRQINSAFGVALTGRRILFLLLACLAGGGCSFRRYAVGELADAVSGSGASFASDSDPELVKEAAPFSLKLIESLLAEQPNHAGLLEAAVRGFTEYSFAFVQEDADEIESRDLQTSEAMHLRARRLYLRAQGYGVRGLEAKHPGFSKALQANPKSAAAMANNTDVPLLYWTAAAWGAAIALGKTDPALVSQVPAVEALIDRALALDQSFGDGAIHTFLITYEMNRQGAAGAPADRSRKHFERAVELSGGKDASPMVAFAEVVDVKLQDAKEFETLLNRALAIDVDVKPETRLQNLVMQRRARWLLSQKSELFLPNHE